MSGMFINLTPSFRNQQICVFSEYSVEMPAISISRDQENRILSQFRQIISTTTVCENIFLDDKGDKIQTVMGPSNPSSTPLLSATHAQKDQESYFFLWMVCKFIAGSPSLFTSDYYGSFAGSVRLSIDLPE